MRDNRAVMGAWLRGRLLVATPPLVDPNFDRTVVLVLEHGDDGALGVVLNRPTDTRISDSVPEWEHLTEDPKVVFAGGPVATTSVIALALGESAVPLNGWMPIEGGLGTVDLARSPDEVPPLDVVRVFVGYAGWAPGQLEGEIDGGAWFDFDLDIEDVFGDDPTTLWKRVLRRQGPRFAMFANCPADVTTN
jgi:putative transcriptional regulator